MHARQTGWRGAASRPAAGSAGRQAARCRAAWARGGLHQAAGPAAEPTFSLQSLDLSSSLNAWGVWGVARGRVEGEVVGAEFQGARARQDGGSAARAAPTRTGVLFAQMVRCHSLFKQHLEAARGGHTSACTHEHAQTCARARIQHLPPFFCLSVSCLCNVPLSIPLPSPRSLPPSLPRPCPRPRSCPPTLNTHLQAVYGCLPFLVVLHILQGSRAGGGEILLAGLLDAGIQPEKTSRGHGVSRAGTRAQGFSSVGNSQSVPGTWMVRSPLQ
jgi:hypothetical protein